MQADLCLCCSHMASDRFSHDVAHIYRKFCYICENFIQTPKIVAVIILKLGQYCFITEDLDGKANSLDPDQTAFPGTTNP